LHPRRRLAGALPDLLEHRAALADDDGLLAVALDVDRGVDAHEAVSALLTLRLVELLHLDGDRVRHLVAEPHHRLLAHVLRGDLALQLVGHHVGREERRRRLRDAPRERAQEVVDVLAGHGRERHDVGPGVEVLVGGDDG
jgi:hypothetical protein